MNIKSPLTGLENVVLENEIESSDIIQGYYNSFKIDVKKFFEGVEKIQVFKCLDTNYRFYYPYSIVGDGEFYTQLQAFNWYYMDWKWEHNNCLTHVSKTDKVLEIGCAKGSFIERLHQMGIDGTGLELNKSAALLGRGKGLNILTEDIQTHVLSNLSKYDVVCSFQVMEHIAEIKEVIQASIDVLKVGGKLIISVPNNDSFLGMDKNYLNMPPHHMGLWNESSLRKLGSVFNLNLKSIHFEQLQSYHKEYFKQTLIKHYSSKYKMFSRVINKLGRRLIPKFEGLFSRKIKAYTIQVVFEKK